MATIDDKLLEKPKVRLWAISQGYDDPFDLLGPEEISTFSAMGDFASETAAEIYEQGANNGPLMDIDPAELEGLKEKVLSESSGRGHGSVDDMNWFCFVIKNLTRIATLMLCGPEWLQHEQQSFRRVKPGNLFYLPDALKEHKEVIDLGTKAFEFYAEMVQAKVPEEDARNLVPLLAKTNITSSSNSRELKHFLHLGSRDYMPSVVKMNVVAPMREQLLGAAPKLFVERATNYEMLGWWPSPVLFAPHNVILKKIISEMESPKNTTYVAHPVLKGTDQESKDKYEDQLLILEVWMERALKERYEPELSLLKHSHNGGPIEGYLAPMSISCFHQMTRQRTLHQAVESIYDAVDRGVIVIPPKIANTEFKERYIEQSRAMINCYKDLVAKGVPKEEAIGIIPHSLMVYDLLHVSGTNAYLFIGKRTCKEAQWEIRGIANDICTDIKKKNPAYKNIASSQGTIYRRCPERNGCPSFAKELKCPSFPGTNPEIFYKL